MLFYGNKVVEAFFACNMLTVQYFNWLKCVLSKNER